MNLNELQKELADTRATIKHKQADVDYYIQMEKDIVKQIEHLKALEDPMLQATNLWCRITNALITKYKIMSEENPKEAAKQLLMLQGALLAGEFLTQEELNKAL